MNIKCHQYKTQTFSEHNLEAKENCNFINSYRSTETAKGSSLQSTVSLYFYMGKSVPSLGKLQELARVITSNRLPQRPSNQIKPPVSRARPLSSPEPSKLSVIRVESKEQQRQLKASRKMGENSNSNLLGQQRRIPLADVVADCARRWFQDTLKEAKAGDTAMQVLVAQMYNSGYGVPVDAQKAKAWMNKASRTRSSAWKVTEKRPGYNASDSDSEDAEGSNK